MARINKDNLTLAMMRIEASDESIIYKVIKQFEINGFKVKTKTFDNKVILYINDKYIIEFNKENKIFEWVDTCFYDRYLIPYRKSLDVVMYLRKQIVYRKTEEYDK